jgi:hypothetical protein
MAITTALSPAKTKSMITTLNKPQMNVQSKVISTLAFDFQIAPNLKKD